MADLIPSGAANPCPICGRDTDGDCRLGETKILCRYGSSFQPPNVKRGQVTTGSDGGAWAFTGDSACGGWAVFVLDEKRQSGVGPATPAARAAGAPRRTRSGPGAERQAFHWLSAAGQLGEGELFSPSKAKGRGYSARWLRWSEQASPEEVQAVLLEAETTGGVWGADEVVKEEEEQARSKSVTRNQRASAQQQAAASVMEKPHRLEAGQLLALLRQQAEGGERIRFNTFHQQVEIDGAPLEGVERFYLSLADQGFKVGKDLALDCLVQVAKEHPYDPVCLYLEHVAATVSPAYIGGLATAYLRPGDCNQGGPTLYDHMLRCTLIGAVLRAFQPGAKHDTTCILSSEQGARKSTFWSILGGPFFSDSLGDLSSKDDLLKLHRSWIMEWAELDHITSRKAAGQIKAFLTTQSDLFRVPYGRAVEGNPRRGIIVGTSNRSEGLLVDDTGNRRFWVIPTTRSEFEPIDTDALAAERDAIWSGAVHAFRAGELNFLPAELAKRVNAENESYQLSNPWRAPIETWLATAANFGRVITSELLLSEAIQKPIERQTRVDQMQVCSILREMGWGRVRRRVDGCLRWVFTPPA